jgi:hypothetical protein
MEQRTDDKDKDKDKDAAEKPAEVGQPPVKEGTSSKPDPYEEETPDPYEE